MIVYKHGSVEYLKAEVTSSEELDAQVVSIHLAGVEYPADWLGDPGLVRMAQTTSPVTISTISAGVHEMDVEVHDTPEVPLFSAGYVSIQD